MADAVGTGAIEILARVDAPRARIEVVNYLFSEPANGLLPGSGKFRFDLCLTARHRGTRGCFTDMWSPHRYEAMGELFVLYPGAELAGKSEETGDLTCVVCEMDAEPVMELFDRLPDPTDELLKASLDVRNDRIHGLMQNLGSEARRPGFASSLLVEMMLGQLSIELVRHGDRVIQDSHRGGLAAWQLRVIDERLREVGPAPSLSELARLCRISVRQLSRAFRVSKQCSLGAYTSQRQLEHAKGLLAGDCSIVAIARQLGFASSSTLCHAFRREVGLSPGEYRKVLVRGTA